MTIMITTAIMSTNRPATHTAINIGRDKGRPEIKQHCNKATLESLLMDTPYKGHNIKNPLH